MSFRELLSSASDSQGNSSRAGRNILLFSRMIFYKSGRSAAWTAMGISSSWACAHSRHFQVSFSKMHYTLADQPFHIYCPFGGSGRCLLTLWGTSPLDFLSAMMARSVVACMLGSDVPSCAELCSLCPQESCRFPTSWFLGLVSCVSSCQAFIFSSELVSLAQKELPLELILQCQFGSGRKRICRFHVCAHAAGAPVFYSGKLVWRNSLKS